MSNRYYYVVEVEILVTADKPELKQQITDEINIFCHKLESIEKFTHIYLSRCDVKCEGPEPRTAAGSLD